MNKKALKDEKVNMLALNDGISKQKTLCILKTTKLFYITLTSLEFANEDTYIHFTYFLIFKSLLCNNPRTCLLFGETNLKAKTAEVNQCLGDEERRISEPKIGPIIKGEKYLLLNIITNEARKMNILKSQLRGSTKCNLVKYTKASKNIHVSS